MPLQGEGVIGGKGDDAIGRCDEIPPLGGGNVHAVMIAAGRAIINALRAK